MVLGGGQGPRQPHGGAALSLIVNTMAGPGSRGLGGGRRRHPGRCAGGRVRVSRGRAGACGAPKAGGAKGWEMRPGLDQSPQDGALIGAGGGGQHMAAAGRG